MDNVFKTMHDTNYLTNEYLYHYCSFETATKIIYNNNLRFSNIYNLNDTMEYKPKIVFKKESPMNEEILNRCLHINRHIKICCFTQDKLKVSRFKKGNDDRYFTDYTGRGFAFPRMWAQYAKNNKGVCFIFNKTSLENTINDQLEIISKGPVNYVERHTCFQFTKPIITAFNKQVLSRNIPDSIVTAKFFNDNPSYIVENYFTKLHDWRDEHEYRIAVFSPEEEDLRVSNIANCIAGIVIGENIDPTDEAILRKLLKKNLPIKKIVFKDRSIILI